MYVQKQFIFSFLFFNCIVVFDCLCVSLFLSILEQGWSNQQASLTDFINVVILFILYIVLLCGFRRLLLVLSEKKIGYDFVQHQIAFLSCKEHWLFHTIFMHFSKVMRFQVSLQPTNCQFMVVTRIVKQVIYDLLCFKKSIIYVQDLFLVLVMLAYVQGM